MLDKPPPTRYRVLEKDRRLIVIDTASGDAVLSVAQALAGKSGNASTPPQTLSAQSLSFPTLERPAGLPSSDKTGRLMMLGAGGVLAVVFLIWSKLWIFIAAALAFPATRTIVWSATTAGIKRFLDGAN